MRDPGVIDALDALARYARAFDAISDEQDARYSARNFVRLGEAGDDGSARWRAAHRRCRPSSRGGLIEKAGALP